MFALAHAPALVKCDDALNFPRRIFAHDMRIRESIVSKIKFILLFRNGRVYFYWRERTSLFLSSQCILDRHAAIQS